MTITASPRSLKRTPSGRVLPEVGASAAPAGGKIHSAPGRLGHHACRHYDRRARCFAVTETVRAARRSFRAVFGKPGPTLSLRDENPAGENRGGTPAGERARKRRAAQAAFSVARPARRLRAGNKPCVCRRSASFYFSWSFVVA